MQINNLMVQIKENQMNKKNTFMHNEEKIDDYYMVIMNAVIS